MSLSVDSNTFKLISEEWKLRRYSAVQLPMRCHFDDEAMVKYRSIQKAPM